MTPREQLEAFFQGREWYDNSMISLIDACKRKGFYSNIGPMGTPLNQKVGPAANFGSCFHSARAAYATGYAKLSEPQRRLRGVRAFGEEWDRYNWRNERGLIPFKHSLNHGIDIWDRYCDHFLIEDPVLRPVESELGFAVEMKPDDGDPCINCGFSWQAEWKSQCDKCGWKTWINVGFADGIFDRNWDGKRLPAELKTTGGNVAGRLRQLNFDHQCVSYVTCLRNFPGLENVDTFIGEVVLVAVKTYEFGRDYFTTNAIQRHSWKRQALRKIEDWRNLKRLAEGKTINEKLSIFYQNTKDCFSYGKCAFYDFCDFGISREVVENYPSATWNPLLHRLPAKTAISANNEIDYITRGD